MKSIVNKTRPALSKGRRLTLPALSTHGISSINSPSIQSTVSISGAQNARFFQLPHGQSQRRTFSSTDSNLSSGFKSMNKEEASTFLENTSSDLKNRLLSMNSIVSARNNSGDSNKRKMDESHIGFSSLQYEATVQSLKEHALRGNVESMLIIYNFLYNHGGCKENADKHAYLLRTVLLGYFHSGRYEHLLQLILQCFEWKANDPKDEEFATRVNAEFQSVLRSFTKLSPESNAIQMKKFFNCEKETAPMHPYVIETLFDALSERSSVSQMRKLLENISSYSSYFMKLNMTSIYNSFLRALILKKEYKKAQNFFDAHFISPLNPNSDQLLQRTNEQAASNAKSSSFFDLEGESDYRIHPNNSTVAEPDLYTYSMLITSRVMNNEIVQGFSITEYLYSKKYYNAVIATQALLTQTFLQSNGKATFEEIDAVWKKYFEQKGIEKEGTKASHSKCVPDSRAVSVYLIALLQAQKHDDALKILKSYSDIYVPDAHSLELLLISLLLHASKSQRLDFLDAATTLYQRYISVEGTGGYRIRMPASFFEQMYNLSRVFINTNAKNSITAFVETLLRDCFHYYKSTQVSGSLVKAVESLNLGELLVKDEKEYGYRIPSEIAGGLPQDLQLFPGIREREHTLSVRDFVSIISLGPLDKLPLSEQEDQMKNIIKYHTQDPSLTNLLFHSNPNHPPKNGTYYSIVSGVKSVGKKEDYLISIPWTIKMVELDILKLKDPSYSDHLRNAIEKWADYELVWASLDTKRSVFPAPLGDVNISSKQLQVLARCIRSGSDLSSQIQDAEKQLASLGASFSSQKELVQAASLLRCAMQQEIDDGIREILNDKSLSPQQQDEKILLNLRKFCPESSELLHQAQIMRGILNPEIVSDILYKCICMSAPIIEQNREARKLFAEQRIQLPQSIAERMKVERDRANILNPKSCPLEVRQSVYRECVMLVMSKQEQNDEAMRILCDLGYALPRTKIETEMRKAREEHMKKKVRAPGTIIPGAL